MDHSARIALEHNLTEAFSPEVERETERWLADPGIDDPALEDWTKLPFCTLDGPSTRHLDQAFHLSVDGDGWLVRYALADAAWFVRPRTALWQEAVTRGASYYLPGLSIPMLPRALSEGVISLGPDGPRRAVALAIRVGPDGVSRGTTLHRVRIRSRAQLSFPEVQAWLDAPLNHPLQRSPCAASLGLLLPVARVREQEAARRHVVRSQRTEIEVSQGELGLPYVLRQVVRDPTEAANAQLSLLCNAEGGRWLAEDPSTDGIWRVHPPPGPGDLNALERIIGHIAAAHGLGNAWTWSRERPLAPWIAGLPATPTRVRACVERQAMIANRPSAYSSTPGLHHGVGADPYARFSAPMREIVGVQVHMEAMQRLNGTSAPHDRALRDVVIASANRARQVQRDLDHAVNRNVMDALFRPGLTFPATLIGTTDGRLHVQLDDPPIDAKVYMRDLAEAWGGAGIDGAVVRDGAGARRMALGDAVSVTVHGRDPTRDRWVLTLTHRNTV